MDESFNQTKSIVQGNIYDVFENKNSLDIATRVGIENYNFKDDKISNKNYNTRTYAVFNDTIRRTFWVGSSTGLELINNNISSKVFYKNKEVFCTDIEKVNDQVWVASSDGVLVFEDDKFLKRIYYQKDTINDKPIKIKQVRGFVYIASKSGFVQYDLNKNKFKSFTKSRCLLSNSILDFEILKDTVYLITTKGLQKFNFKDIVFKDKANKVNVLKVLVNGTKEIVESDILQPTENNLEFEVLSISLTNKQNIKYHYLLEGYETKWNETSFSNNRIKYFEKVAYKSALIIKGKSFEGVVFKGLSADFNWKNFSNYITTGRVPSLNNDVSNEVLISENLSKKLLINLDDKFEATFFKSSSASNPNKRIFKVVGIYSSGLTEFDEVYFFGDIRHVQKMNKWTKDEFGNIEIFLKKYSYTNDVSDDLYNQTPPNISVMSINEKFPEIFNWMSLFDFNVLLIIIIMIYLRKKQ